MKICPGVRSALPQGRKRAKENQEEYNIFPESGFLGNLSPTASLLDILCAAAGVTVVLKEKS